MKNISKRWANEIFNDLSLEIGEGEFVCILGKTGCGKTTLLQIMAGFLDPDKGEILCNDTIVNKPKKNTSFVFQDLNQLFPWKTVLENVAFAVRASCSKNRKEAKETANYYLKQVGLLDFKTFYPHQLSGGMKQRVALARSVAINPDIIFMDEPFAHIDVSTRNMLYDELISIWNTLCPTVCFVTHDIDEAMRLASRIVVLGGVPAEILLDVKNDGDEGAIRNKIEEALRI